MPLKNARINLTQTSQTSVIYTTTCRPLHSCTPNMNLVRKRADVMIVIAYTYLSYVT